MTDTTTPKIPETHPVSKKYPLPIMVLMTIVLMIVIGIGMYKKTSSNSNSVESEKGQPVEWGLCWEDNEEKRCSVVKKIVFDGEKIIMMSVYCPSTSVRTDFFRDPNQSVGIYTQPGEKGRWTLTPTSAGGYAGTISNHEGWKAHLIVEPIITVK